MHYCSIIMLYYYNAVLMIILPFISKLIFEKQNPGDLVNLEKKWRMRNNFFQGLIQDWQIASINYNRHDPYGDSLGNINHPFLQHVKLYIATRKLPSKLLYSGSLPPPGRFGALCTCRPQIFANIPWLHIVFNLELS